MAASVLRNAALQNYARVFLSAGFYRGIVALVGILLARVLSPAEVGLLAISFFLINILKVFINNGIGEALVYFRDEKAYGTAFTLSLLSGIAFYALLFLLAPLFAALFDEPLITYLIRALGLYLIFSGVGRVPGKMLERSLDFKRRVVPEVAGAVVFLVAVLMMLDKGIDAFVIGFLASAAAENLLLLFIAGTPRLSLAGSARVLGYAKHILSASLVIYMLVNIDDFVVGKMLGMGMLGFYSLAYIASNTPATQITHLANRIMFPMYARQRGARLRKTYVLNLEMVSWGSFLLTGLIFAYAPQIIMHVLGEKWLPAVVPMRLLCIAGLIRSVTATTGELFKAVGKPALLAKYSLWQLLLLVALVIPGTMLYGLAGAAIAVTIPKLAVQGFAVRKACSLLRLPVKRFFSVLALPGTCLAIMLALSFLLSARVTGIWSLIAACVASAGAYIISLFLLRKDIWGDMAKL